LYLKACKFILISLLCISAWLLLIGVSDAIADPVKPPQTCRIGIYITSLRNFKFADKSFTANFRLWSVCPIKELKPLENIEIIDSLESNEISISTLDKKIFLSPFPQRVKFIGLKKTSVPSCIRVGMSRTIHLIVTP